jgi:Flp pilus assembly protein TadD
VSLPRSRAALALGLALLTLAAYEGVRRCGFVSFDDDVFVYRNPYVRQGLTGVALRWALGADLLFESPHADYWMPVTVLSRMLDVQLFGLNPAAHHAVNALLHGVNVLLVFLMLDGLTGARYRSAFAAAVLAVHPLAVESVAWVTERKDVLSALFWMLSMIAYGRYARGGGRAAYAAALLFMALGLMAKPTLVALPLALLVLDFWPLRRWPALAARRLVAEKVPFFAMAAASAALTLLSHARGGHLASAAAAPLSSRLANALWSLVVYIDQFVWPTRLAVFYPLTDVRLTSVRTLAALAALAFLAWLAARNASRRPYLITGGLWSLLALAPVLGLVQTGQQAHADRFMYVPLVGVAIVLAWGAFDLAAPRPALRRLLPWAALVVLVAWTVLTRAQVRHWETTVTLFSHAAAVTKDNALAHMNLGRALARQGDAAGAERHYREALRIRPHDGDARTGLGALLMQQGRMAEALEQHEEAVRRNPASADARFNLGAAEARRGRTAEAAAQYAEALRLDPRLPAAHYNWGNLLAAEGQWAEAESRFAEAARLQPENVDAVNNLGLAIGLQGRWPEAAEVLRRAVALDPSDARARVNLGRALRALGRPAEARAQWQEALWLDPVGPAAAEAREELARP